MAQIILYPIPEELVFILEEPSCSIIEIHYGLN